MNNIYSKHILGIKIYFIFILLFNVGTAFAISTNKLKSIF